MFCENIKEEMISSNVQGWELSRKSPIFIDQVLKIKWEIHEKEGYAVDTRAFK